MSRLNKISLITTVFNDSKNIIQFINNILEQSIQPDEIIIVDGGSKDSTVELAQSINNKKIKIIVDGRKNIAEGLNYGISIARNGIIAICLVGVKYDNTWLEKLTAPIVNNGIELSATYYEILAESMYAEVYKLFYSTKNRNKNNFNPSSRSIAYRKYVWNRIGGYYEKFIYAGEDTKFILDAKKYNFRIKVVEENLCKWILPSTFIGIIKHKKYYIIADKEMGMNNKYYIKKALVILALLGNLGMYFITQQNIFSIIFIFLFILIPIRKLIKISNWRAIPLFIILYYSFIVYEIRYYYLYNIK